MTRIDELLDEARQLPRPERKRIVVELTAGLAPPQTDEVESAEIPGQVDGYWFKGVADIPSRKPDYAPTGAVLPSGGKLDGDTSCLDIFFVEGSSVPLSESGLYTYAHSGSLTYGDPYFFVPAEQWGSVYRAVLGDMLEPSELKTEFGEVAAERARPDRKAITLRLTRQNEELG